MLKLYEEPLAVEEAKMNGIKGYSVREVVQMMNNVIDEAGLGMSDSIYKSVE